MIKKYIYAGLRERLQTQAEKIGLQSRQVVDVMTVIKNTVKEVLQAEFKSGNYNQTIIFLKNSSVKLGRSLLVDRIVQRVVGRLMLKFNLPYAVALNLTILLVPFILKRISKINLKSGQVQDLFSSLGIHKQVERLKILQNQLRDKFEFGKAAGR